ncbi:MAG: hypothetical protein H6741_08045 [Alphaproteobacteria bacterium]|nr:hypothetical protein [Alphaproteobacteria bacterium]
MRTLPLLALLACTNKDEAVDSAPLPLCYADEVPEEAQLRPGWQEDGTLIGPGGRLIVPAGETLRFDLMPIDVVAHPSLPVAYVTLVSRSQRALAVVDLDRMEVLQELSRGDNHRGLVVSADGARLYAAGGAGGELHAFDVNSDGTLSELTPLTVGGTTTGLALTADGATLYMGSFYEDTIYEVDTASLSLSRTLDVTVDVWDVLLSEDESQLFVSDLSSEGLSVLDLASGAEAAVLQIPTSPAGMDRLGNEVLVAVSNGDLVAAVDTAGLGVSTYWAGGEDLLDEDGAPLGNTNVNALRVGPDGERLFVARGATNSVGVYDAASRELLGSFPVSMYPADLEFAADGRLLVAEYKGYIGDEGNSWKGSLGVVDVDALDLADTSVDVAALYTSPLERYPFECEGRFPIPATPDSPPSPIEHVVVIVKENKTLDCLFGDMGGQIDADLDEEYLRWPAELTPNQRALIEQFNVSDNFYTDAMESDSGHLMLTSVHLTHFVEWMWMETSHSGGALTWPVAEVSTPELGNFFTHLLDEERSLQVYGEIVGMFETSASGELVFDHSDADYPGGPFVNYGVTDEEKADYIAERVAEDGLADFTYISLPNDHTAGTDGEFPSPESMVADNDRAVGVVVEAISNHEDWASTVIFILQDDPQGCDDHVDESRSLLIVASPYARRGGYVSHVNADFLSVFAMTERILDVPPMAQPDAAATPIWDLFVPEPDLSPFTSLPRADARRTRPEYGEGEEPFGAALSRRLDFSGPDRNPELAPLIDAYMLWRMGRLSREEAEARLYAPYMSWDEEDWEELEEEAEEEGHAFDLAWAQYEAWCAAQGRPAPVRPGR